MAQLIYIYARIHAHAHDDKCTRTRTGEEKLREIIKRSLKRKIIKQVKGKVIIIL